MQKLTLTSVSLIFALFCTETTAQLTDDFSDGNFTNDPVWMGDGNSWIVNQDKKLQSNNTTTGAAYYLSTQHTTVRSTQWEMNVRVGFNTSSTNFVDMYLTASAADVASGTTTGYFVRIGNTDDEVCLYRKNTGGGIIKIIDGRNGITNTGNNALKVKVTCNATGTWTLHTDITATGSSYVREGSVADTTYITSAYFGIYVKQSTAGFFQKHWFDDIEIKPYVPDLQSPLIATVKAISATELDVLFSEAVDSATATVRLYYLVNNAVGSPVTVVADIANPALMHLVFANSFADNITYIITVNSVKDLAGNAVGNASASFSLCAKIV